jgi:hypothetical protein
VITVQDLIRQELRNQCAVYNIWQSMLLGVGNEETLKKKHLPKMFIFFKTWSFHSFTQWLIKRNKGIRWSEGWRTIRYLRENVY